MRFDPSLFVACNGRSAGRHKTPRLAAMLFKQLHIGDGHAPVHGFAHVINREQGHLHGGEGFNKINNFAHFRLVALTRFLIS